jgi:hypothetical protein
VTDPFVELPDELCFDRREAGELLNLVDWLRDVLRAAANDEGAVRADAFKRLVQRRLWGDIQDLVDDDPDEGEGYPHGDDD